MTLILIEIPLLLELSRRGNPCLVCVCNASQSWHGVGCRGWVPCFVCFPAFRGHVTLFLACLLKRFSECLQLGHSLEVTTKIDRFLTHWRLYCLEHCLRVLLRFKIIAILAVWELKVRKQEWFYQLSSKDAPISKQNNSVEREVIETSCLHLTYAYPSTLITMI